MKRLPRRICLLGGLLRTLYYRRVDILGTPCRDRPTLYLLSHRNGAIDGFVYQKALGDTPSLISVQLLRGPLRLPRRPRPRPSSRPCPPRWSRPSPPPPSGAR